MTLTEIKTILAAQKPHLSEKYGVLEIGVFGSYVRGEADSTSDLDLLITLSNPPKISLLGLVNLQHYLSDLLGLEVDIALKNQLKRRIGQQILQEVEVL
jgi:predicted nucleotidyltransferase